MTRCEEFYQKVEKDGNFCGMKDHAYRDLMNFRDFQAKNAAIAALSEGAARKLISEPDEAVKAKAIEVIGEKIAAGEPVTGKIVKEVLTDVGHVAAIKVEEPVKEVKEYTSEELGKKTQELNKLMGAKGLPKSNLPEERALEFEGQILNDLSRIVRDAFKQGWTTKTRLVTIVSQMMYDELDVTGIKIEMGGDENGK